MEPGNLDPQGFIDQHPECLKAETALGECHVVSRAFKALHPSAQLVIVDCYEGDASLAQWKSDPGRWIHTVVEYQGVYWDFTARQFNPNHPVPRVLTREELKREWGFLTPMEE